MELCSQELSNIAQFGHSATSCTHADILSFFHVTDSSLSRPLFLFLNSLSLSIFSHAYSLSLSLSLSLSHEISLSMSPTLSLFLAFLTLSLSFIIFILSGALSLACHLPTDLFCTF